MLQTTAQALVFPCTRACPHHVQTADTSDHTLWNEMLPLQWRGGNITEQ